MRSHEIPGGGERGIRWRDPRTPREKERQKRLARFPDASSSREPNSWLGGIAVWIGNFTPDDVVGGPSERMNAVPRPVDTGTTRTTGPNRIAGTPPFPGTRYDCVRRD